MEMRDENDHVKETRKLGNLISVSESTYKIPLVENNKTH